MAFQVIVRNADEAHLRKTVCELDANIEVFAIDASDIGISVPTKVIDQVSEAKVRKLLSQYKYYDLWAGSWHDPNRSFMNRFLKWHKKG